MKNELYNIADAAFKAVNALGADGAELTVSRGRMDELNVDSGEFSLCRTTFNASLAARVLVGGKKGLAISNNLERGAVEKTLEQAVEAAKSAEPDEAEYIADGIGEHEFEIGAGECDLDAVYEKIHTYMEDARRQYPKILSSQSISQYISSDALYANTNGTRAFTHSASYDHNVIFCAKDGDRVSSMDYFEFSELDPNTPFFDRPEVHRMLSETERQIDTAPVEGKFVGTLLMSPDCFAEMLYSIIGNCVTDTPLIAGSSPWLKKLGEAVADKRLSVAYDPLDPRVICGARVTADGHLTRRQDLIRGGALAGWALSQYGAKKTGLERAGNVSGNLIVGAGDRSFDEMVSGVERGILMNRFSGGAPAQNGDFSGVAKNSFIIRNGRIAEAVSETMVSGNFFEMLQNIAGLGDTPLCNGGFVVPFAAFGGVTISGK